MVAARASDEAFDWGSQSVVPLDEDMAELALLLPGWQVAALENAAHSQGLTTGQRARCLTRFSLSNPPPRTRLPPLDRGGEEWVVGSGGGGPPGGPTAPGGVPPPRFPRSRFPA